MTDDSPSPSAAEQRLAMKRARDRRAQQNARDKKNNRIHALECQLAQCRRQNAAYLAQIQQLQQTCRELRRSNAKLGSGQELVSAFVDSWQSRDAHHAHHPLQLDPPSTGTSTTSTSTSASTALVQHTAASRFSEISEAILASSAGHASTINAPIFFDHHHHHPHPATAAAAPDTMEQQQHQHQQHQQPPLQLSSQFIDPQLSAFSISPALYTSHMFTIPLWGMTTLQSEPAGPGPGHRRVDITWRADPALVRAQPEFPEAPDLLFGGAKNYLSNKLHDSLRQIRRPDPERLAAGWVDYLLWRWMLEPSEQRYLNLPDFLRPVAEQIQCPHPSALDMIPWPRMRARLISKQADYDLHKVIALLARSYKLRWPRGESIVEPDDKGVIRVRQAFMDAFMSLDRWCVTHEFIREYPELVEGLDPRNLMP